MGRYSKTAVELLHLSAEEARRVVLAYTSYDQQLRIALRQRLMHLSANATKDHIRSFLRLVPRMRRRITSAFEPLLTQHPELRPWIERAKSNLVANPGNVLAHIDGETETGWQLSGGGHHLPGFETLADVALSEWPKEDRKRFAAATAKLNRRATRRMIIGMYGKMGFDLSGDRWQKFLLLDQIRWKIDRKPNGVKCFRVPRTYFNSKGWKNTVASAKYGVSPIGGKSLFPRTWDQDHILNGIIGVLDHPEPFVLRRATKGGVTYFYLRARIRNVHLEVGISGERVCTAFPSWRQRRRRGSIADAYLIWFAEWWRLYEAVQYRAWADDTFARVDFPNGIMSGYLGQCPNGITAVDWDTLQIWLRPTRVSEAPNPNEALTLQLIIFDWMERSRVVQELEGVSGPVH